MKLPERDRRPLASQEGELKVTNLNAVVVDGLSRSFGKGSKAKQALKDINLKIPAGEVHGLLGPNGAGKSTLSKILATIIVPTRGRVAVMGYDVSVQAAEVRKHVALVLGGDKGLYGRLTPRQNLEFWCAANGMSGRARIRDATNEALEKVGILAIDRPVETFSRGMMQRVHLARALAVSPTVLILDEPTMGLDPAAALAFRSLIVEARENGATVLVATHDMAEAQAICDRVSLIVGGQIVFTDRPENLLRRAGGALIKFDDPLDDISRRNITKCLSAMGGEVEIIDTAGAVEVRIASESLVPEVLKQIVFAGQTNFSVRPPTLEDVYLANVGKRGLQVD